MQAIEGLCNANYEIITDALSFGQAEQNERPAFVDESRAQALYSK